MGPTRGRGAAGKGPPGARLAAGFRPGCGIGRATRGPGANARLPLARPPAAPQHASRRQCPGKSFRSRFPSTDRSPEAGRPAALIKGRAPSRHVQVSGGTIPSLFPRRPNGPAPSGPSPDRCCSKVVGRTAGWLREPHALPEAFTSKEAIARACTTSLAETKVRPGHGGNWGSRLASSFFRPRGGPRRVAKRRPVGPTANAAAGIGQTTPNRDSAIAQNSARGPAGLGPTLAGATRAACKPPKAARQPSGPAAREKAHPRLPRARPHPFQQSSARAQPWEGRPGAVVGRAGRNRGKNGGPGVFFS